MPPWGEPTPVTGGWSQTSNSTVSGNQKPESRWVESRGDNQPARHKGRAVVQLGGLEEPAARAKRSREAQKTRRGDLWCVCVFQCVHDVYYPQHAN